MSVLVTSDSFKTFNRVYQICSKQFDLRIQIILAILRSNGYTVTLILYRVKAKNFY